MDNVKKVGKGVVKGATKGVTKGVTKVGKGAVKGRLSVLPCIVLLSRNALCMSAWIIAVVSR